MLSIGEFSRVTQLSIKALRLYHRKGILLPDEIDYDSRYRYYSRASFGKALIIKNLKEMGFSLNEISRILQECNDDKDIAEHVERKMTDIEKTIEHYKDIKDHLSLFLQSLQEEKITCPQHIDTVTVPDMKVCGIRFKGRYDESGSRFSMLFRRCGRYASGKPFSLYYDGEYKEEGADIEACVEVRKAVNIRGIHCRELKGGRAVALIHKGPYEELNSSYLRLFEYCRANGLETEPPIRECYLKGHGIIFRGNPKKYVTRLMIFCKDTPTHFYSGKNYNRGGRESFQK